MDSIRALLLLLSPVTATGAVAGLPGGPPVAGWSTWNTFACSINATLVKQGADHLVSSGLLAAGYEYIVRITTVSPTVRLPDSHPLARVAHWPCLFHGAQLIDDCWSSCVDYDQKNGYCKKTGGRDEQGRLIPDPVKFPDGSESLFRSPG